MKTQTRPMLLHAAIAACAVLAGLPLASADNIPIGNPSFEQPRLLPGGTASLTGWGVGDGSWGVTRPVDLPHPTNGRQVAFMRGQVLASLGNDIGQNPGGTIIAANTVYTLQADFIGGEIGFTAELRIDFDHAAPSPIVGTLSSSLVTVSPGQTKTVTVVYKSLPGDIHIGADLWIFLSVKHFAPATKGDPVAYFDNFRLQAFPAANVTYLNGAFGNFGILPIEAAHLNGYCDGSTVQDACEVTFKFADLQGTVLGESTQTIPPGASAAFALPSTRIAVGPLQVVPSFTVIRGKALFSFEVFDPATLRTRILINWCDGSRKNTGDVDLGLATLTASDVGRLGAYCPADGSKPCNVVFEFHDSKGRLLKQSQITLQPGTGGIAELQYREAATTSAGGQVLIVPCFKVADGAIIGTFALVDSATGRTITQVYPAASASAPGGQRGDN